MKPLIALHMFKNNRSGQVGTLYNLSSKMQFGWLRDARKLSFLA
jgi:hypothetical protein